MGTREAIRAEFMCVYARERLDRITVKALCAAVPVARTTFYAHYRNVDDVLAEVGDDLLDGLVQVAERVSGGGLRHMDFSVFLNETFGHIRANWTDFRALPAIQPSMRFVARWKDAVKASFARRYPKARARQLWELLSEMAAPGTVGAHRYAAMKRGKAVCLQGAFTKAMAFGSRLVPRAVARRIAMRMNR